MRKLCAMVFLPAVFLFVVIFPVHAADNVTGLWIMPDDKKNNPPAAVVFMYMYDGKLYGRVLVLFDTDTGLVMDTINTQTVRENNLADNPPLCGLDFIFEMQDDGKDWRGTLVSLPGGKFHNCTIRREGNRLIVRASLRGVLGFIGVNLPFEPATTADLPEGVTVPLVNTIVPVIPKK